MVMPETARKGARHGKRAADVSPSPRLDPAPGCMRSEIHGDEEALARTGHLVDELHPSVEPKKIKRCRPHQRSQRPWSLRLRGAAADTLEWAFDSEDLVYAFKITTAVFLVSFPALIAPWNSWYGHARGVWAPLQLVLVFEVAIGASFFVFMLRAAGVIFGCVVGYLAFVIGNGNPVVLAVIIALGTIPSAYVQVGTPYVKAGMISVVSMTVVALGKWPLQQRAASPMLTAAATVNRSGTPEEIFGKRLAAFMVGGSVALIIEVVLYPVKARDRLNESLCCCLQEVMNMQTAIGSGIDSPTKVDIQSKKLNSRFRRARDKAQTALVAAETFLPFCLSEPRLKGSFRNIEPIYKEIIYVLHQIVDRMDNVVQLRTAYGSSVLEDLNLQVYTYRRDVAASITITLFAVNEALVTRLPLPQFIPSARSAQIRLIHKIREILAMQSSITDANHRRSITLPSSSRRAGKRRSVALDATIIREVTSLRFLSWNAAAAGQMEINEYLEELVDLAKLLVGVNAFRSGMLERPSYREYVRRIKIRTRQNSLTELDDADETDIGRAETAAAAASTTGLQRMKSRLTGRSTSDDKLKSGKPGAKGPAVSESQTIRQSLDLPPSLQRVGTRMRQERSIGRQRAASYGKGKAVAEDGGLGDETDT